MAAGSATGQTGSNAWSQLDQLLTCAICLDRYRNPKLLPCQHTFCMEPCLEGLIDYVRRQIKCPECRAEHRIPYQGIQGYPTNVTLMRFLELHFEVTGEVPDPTPAMMERCGVCTEKSYLGHCAHCDKKVCTDCKESHLDIMKREISRINNQVRRGLNRLQDALAQTEKSTQQLQTNCKTVLEEIEEIYRRLQKGLKDREEALKAEVLTFLQNELRSAEALKENLDTEVSNIQSNSELVEKHVTDNAEWDDVELMEYKDTFLRTLEFLRNFDPDQADFSRRLKFQLGPEPEAVHQQVVSVGELTISAPNFPGSCVTSTVGTVGSVGSGMLMRSKSEHRLASSTSAATTAASAQRHDAYLGFAQRVSGHAGGHSSDTETRDGRTSPLSRRRTGDLSESAHQLRRSLGERAGRDYDDGGGERSYRRYGRSSDHITESRWQREDASDYAAGSYRSRFSRESGELQRDSSDGDVFGSRSVRFARQQQQQEPEQTIRERVLETEDATRGPLSGICRLMDSPRVMERLQQQEQRQKQQQVKQQQQPPPAPTPVVTPAAPVPRVRTARQVSEEDEIAKQKAQNKKEGAQVETSTTTTTQPPPPPESPTRALVRRVLSQTATETTETEAQRRRYGTVTTTTARSEDAGDLPRRPTSRQMSRDVSDSETVRPPSRQTSVADAKETLSGTADKSTASSESSSKEDDSPAPASRRRFFPRTQSERPSILKGSGTSAITESNSDSDSDAKTPTPQAGTASTLARQPSLEDVTSQEKPNYFRYRTAAYSRSPSNSSVNLDSQDESGRSGALSPTPSQQQPQYARPKTPASRTAIDDAGAKERSKSTDSSSSGSSDSSSNATQSRSTTTAGGSSTTTTSTGDKGDLKSISSRYASFRGSADVDKKDTSTTKDDGVSAARVPSLAVAGRATSLDKKSDVGVKPRFVSRFLPRTSSLCRDDKRDSDSSDSDSDDNGGAKDPPRRSARESEGASPISALLARSAIARRDNTSGATTGSGPYHGVGTTSARSSAYARDRERDEAGGSSGSGRRTGSGSSYHLHGRDDLKKDAGDPTEGRYSSLASKYLTRSRTSLCEDESVRDDAKYGGASYASRYLSKSKSSAALGFERDGDAADESSSLARRTSVTGASSSERYGAGRKESRYGGGGASVRRSRLGRSKSSHEIHGGEDDDDDDVGVYGGGGSTSAERETESSRVGAYRTSSRFERPSDYAIARSRSHHALNSRDPSPEADTGSSALSSWARYLKAKYGNKGKEKEYPIGRSSSSHALYSREASSESSEEERGPGTTRDSTRRDSTVSYSPGYGGLNSGIGVGGRASAENPRSAYLQKRRVVMKIGARGSDRGSFTWPRGIAVGLDNSIVVADSSNHRVQVFDANGSFCKEFGAYGNADGEFDCLAGVAVNRIGQYIVSDRYNHRIQVFDPSGRFLRAFGSQGSVDGKLSYPWGVATDSLGFIYVCDKENHRVQVFQSDGTFVGKFGSLGNKPGQLEHPHYVAVSSTNKVVVSDSNNHRVQIFDVNGRVLSAFGSEGSDEGQFKFPRGVAVDDQGYIIVGDSGNNRIQVFQPDGTFLKAYGTWGSGDGEFKGLEGVAVTSNANILVCDRENHRIQIF